MLIASIKVLRCEKPCSAVLPEVAPKLSETGVVRKSLITEA